MKKEPRNLIKEFQPWMVEAAWKHVEAGHSFGSFAGKYHIQNAHWCDWSKQYDELRRVNDAYKAKLRGEKFLWMRSKA